VLRLAMLFWWTWLIWRMIGVLTLMISSSGKMLTTVTSHDDEFFGIAHLIPIFGYSLLNLGSPSVRLRIRECKVEDMGRWCEHRGHKAFKLDRCGERGTRHTAVDRLTAHQTSF
jgi:hypothetical protein